MVMMLTAGLGVSEITMGCDRMREELGGVTTLLLSKEAAEIPLDTKTKEKPQPMKRFHYRYVL